MASISSQEFFKGQPGVYAGNEGDVQEQEQKSGTPSFFRSLLNRGKVEEGRLSQEKEPAASLTLRDFGTSDKLESEKMVASEFGGGLSFPTSKREPGFIEDLSQKADIRADRIGEILARKETPLFEKYVLQTGGQGLGLVTDLAAKIFEKAVEVTPGADKALEAYGKAISTLATDDRSPLKWLGEKLGSTDFAVEAVKLYDTDQNFKDTVDGFTNINVAALDLAGALQLANSSEKIVKNVWEKSVGLAPGSPEAQVIEKSVKPYIKQHIDTRLKGISDMAGDPDFVIDPKQVALGVKSDLVLGLNKMGYGEYASAISKIPDNLISSIDDVARLADETLKLKTEGLLPGITKTATETVEAGRRLIGGAVDEITTGVSSGIDDVISKAKSSTDIKTGLTGKLDTFARKSIDNSVNELVDSRVTSSRKAKELLERNIDVRENLKDIEIYNGIKVKDNKINTDLAVDTIQNRIDVALDAKAKILPQIDKFGETIKPFDEAFQADIRAKVTALNLPPVEEAKILKSIEKQLDGIPTEMLPSEADALRAKFRNAASDAKGRLKRDSEFNVLQEVFRDSVFKATDNVSFGEAGSFAKLNDYVKNQIETINYLESVVNGSVVKGGRLKNYFARAIGAVAGSGQGIIGSIVGAELSGVVADIITNNQLGSSVKMSLLKEIVSDPKALREIQKLVDAAENYRPLELPSPASGSPRSQVTGGRTIELPARSETITDEGQPSVIINR